MGDATEKVAEQVPEREVRDHRLVRGGHEEQAQERRGPAVHRAGGRLPRRLPLRACTPRTTTSRTIGSVGGQKIPPVDHYIAGYQAGAKKADPGIKTLNAYSQDFVDQAKCKEIALNQIAKGSKVEFQVAGQCGLGVARRGQGEEHPGHRRGRRPGLPGPAGLHQRAEEGRRRRVNAIKGVQDGQVHRRPGRHQLGEVRRHRLRQAQRRGPEVRRSGPAGPGGHRGRQDHEHPGYRQVRHGERPRAARDHEALRADRRQRRGRLRPEARRGPRAARGERRRQVDADERPLRALHARRGRDPRRRPARQHRLAAARPSSSGSAWSTSTSCSSRS